jgi:hypothetical protein
MGEGLSVSHLAEKVELQKTARLNVTQNRL